MGYRRQGRILALQMLYARDVRDQPDGAADAQGDQLIEDGESVSDPEVQAFAEALCRAEIDQVIEQAAKNWRLARMNPIDRSVLRLATWELIHGETDRAVVINEAVELAKAFGSGESARFVNGVLDAA